MSKHAPGPWKVTSGLYGPNIESEDGYAIAHMINGEGSDYKANARLIAAAPRMYELLSNIYQAQRNYQRWEGFTTQIKNIMDEIDGKEASHDHS